MPRRRQSFKARRQAKKRQAHNVSIKHNIKKNIKKLQALVTAKKMEEAKDSLKVVISQLTKAAKKGILHKNTARRKQSRLSQKVAKLNAANI